MGSGRRSVTIPIVFNSVRPWPKISSKYLKNYDLQVKQKKRRWTDRQAKIDLGNNFESICIIEGGSVSNPHKLNMPIYDKWCRVSKMSIHFWFVYKLHDYHNR